MSPQALSSHHYRTTKLASKVLSRDQIGKAPSHVEAATIIAPAVTAHCFNVSRPVPLVHVVQLLTEAAQRHDHFYDMRERFFDLFGASAAFVVGHCGSGS